MFFPFRTPNVNKEIAGLKSPMGVGELITESGSFELSRAQFRSL